MVTGLMIERITSAAATVTAITLGGWMAGPVTLITWTHRSINKRIGSVRCRKSAIKKNIFVIRLGVVNATESDSPNIGRKARSFEGSSATSWDFWSQTIQ